MSRTIVYIDALNLYYRALRFTTHKWLNLEALALIRQRRTANVLICGLSKHCHLFPLTKAILSQAGFGRA